MKNHYPKLMQDYDPTKGYTRINGIARFRGLYVVDATEDVEMHITQGDITRGVKRDPAACANSQCGMRQFDTPLMLTFRSRVFVYDPRSHHLVKYNVGIKLRTEENAFDRECKDGFQPGVYVLKKPSLPRDRKPGKTSGKHNLGAGVTEVNPEAETEAARQSVDRPTRDEPKPDRPARSFLLRPEAR